jgi:mannobiose 2-epimerase
VSHAGKPVDTTKHTYNHAFAIYALAAYYEASQDERALELAHQLFVLIESRFTDSNSYLEAFDADFHPIQNDKLSEHGVVAKYTMNTLLHVFEAYAGFYQASPNPKIAAAMRRILNIFQTVVYNSQEQRLEAFFDAELKSLLDLHSYGHDIEASWLLDWGTGLLADQALTERVATMTSALAQTVFTKAYRDGAVDTEALKGIPVANRVWWVQAEAMLGFENEAVKNPSQGSKYRQAVAELWDFIATRQIDPRPNAEWLWEVDRFGAAVPGRPIVSNWKCPYHNGRACLRLLRDQSLEDEPA